MMNILRDILVPRSLVLAPEKFGGETAGDCLRGDLHLSGAGPHHMIPSNHSNHPRMVLPALTEAHCHLDKCHTGQRLGAVGGDLRQAITAQRKDKENWTYSDLHTRMQIGMRDLQKSGCAHVRSHIDWSDGLDPPLAWSVLKDLAVDTHDLTLQSSALLGIDQLADKDFCSGVAHIISQTSGGVLGAFVLGHEKMQAGLRNAFEAAERFGLALDFHVDEGLGNLNGLEMICDTAIATKFEGPVLCGHAVSLIEKEGEDLSRIFDKLVRSGIAVCALPTTNLYLQDRQEGTPNRRGLTRLREMAAADVPIVIGSDNVDDAFCPMGAHDPRAALHLAALAAHLDPPMGQWLPLITTHAEKAMGLACSYVDMAHVSKLRICAVSNTADLVAGRAPLLAIETALKEAAT